MSDKKLCIMATGTPVAEAARAGLARRYGSVPLEEADVVIALGGDGFMLSTLHQTEHRRIPVYGMNRGTVGFLMNAYSEEALTERLDTAELAELHPLRMRAKREDGSIAEALAINEVSILRAGAQAAKLKISVDGRERMAELVADGALVATPAGSTAYNYSAHGPILPIGAEVLALTAVAAFRPRRWRGALLPGGAQVSIDVLEHEKRPVRAAADSREVANVLRVDLQTELSISHRILFDPGHGLEERLLREQFV